MYFYTICSPKNKRFHTNLSKTVLEYLSDSTEWESTNDKKKAHFCDCPNNGIIKYEFTTNLKNDIFNKLAQYIIFRNCSFYPQTIGITNGKLLNLQNFQPSNNSKWFLKPLNQYGGNGINILSKIQDYVRYVSFNQNYIIQKEIDCILYKKRKFDIRSYLLIVVNDKKMKIYLSKDSAMRICSYEYNPKSVRKDINLTNLSLQNSNKSDIKVPNKNSMSLSKWEHYDTVQPKLEKIVSEMGDVLQPLIKQNKSVYLSGCDFIIDKQLEPYFLEMNSKTGFTFSKYPDDTAKMLKEMICEMIEIGYKPLIDSDSVVESKHWKLCY